MPSKNLVDVAGAQAAAAALLEFIGGRERGAMHQLETAAEKIAEAEGA